MNRFLIAVLPVALIAGAFPAAAEITAMDTSIPAPGCYTGNGCDNSGFTQSNNGTTELDLNANIRFVGAVTPVGNVYNVPTSAGPLATWDYGFSILTQVNGSNGGTLSDYTYLLTLTDVNNNASISFDPLSIADDDGYGPTGKTAGSVDPTTQWGAQNYENFGFPIIGTPGFDASADDTYTVTLTESSNGAVDNSDTITINAGAGSPTPEPGTFALAGLVLAGLGIVRAKARKA